LLDASYRGSQAGNQQLNIDGKLRGRRAAMLARRKYGSRQNCGGAKKSSATYH
jgi:hypothetical protein